MVNMYYINLFVRCLCFFVVSSVVGLLLMTCSCGGLSGNFSELPFDTREHLIAYHTEGRGEDKVK